MPAAILKSKLVQFASAVVLLLLVFFLGEQMYKKYQINREMRQLQEEIASLESKNQDILKVIDYLKTPEYKERQARSLLGLQKPGEFVVVLPGEEEEEKTLGAEETVREPTSNFLKWWNYFFSKKQ